MKPRVMIVVVHGLYHPWDEILINGQLKTWMQNTSGIKIVNAFGQALPTRLIETDRELYYLRWHQSRIVAFGCLALEAMLKFLACCALFRPKVMVKQDPLLADTWELKMPDSLFLQGVKNIAVLRESLKHDFEFLVTAISSTYINVPLLLNFLSNQTQSCFAGGRIEASGNMNYQQGSFRVYSRDVVEDLVKNATKYRHWKIEDIAMGHLLNRFNPQLTEIPNVSIDSVEKVDGLTQSELEQTVSYRCKSFKFGKRDDVKVMNKLHKRILDI